jgi:hypothetical protein
MLCRDSRQSFLFYADNVPRECCSFPKFFLILYCRNCGYLCRFSADIFTKVFFAVLCRKSDSFTIDQRSRATPISCIYSIGVPTSILLAYYRCGALYRLFWSRFCQNLLLDRRKSSPHFLFLYINPPHRRCYGNRKWL